MKKTGLKRGCKIFFGDFNPKFMIQTTLLNLRPNECSQEFHYYPFAVKLDRCARSCNLSNKIYVPNKTEDLNLSVFNMIAGMNKSKH